jgi:hypothetical protein
VASQDETRNRAAERDADGWPTGSKPTDPPAAAEPAENGHATPPAERTDELDERQRKAIFGQFNALHITDADEQRQVLAGILGREVSSRKGLSHVDADKVLKDLRARPRPAKAPAS